MKIGDKVEILLANHSGAPYRYYRFGGSLSQLTEDEIYIEDQEGRELIVSRKSASFIGIQTAGFQSTFRD